MTINNERLKQHIDNPLESGLSRSEVMDTLRELLALREAGKEPVAFTEKHEISNMQATGLYLRAWPADRKRNAIEGYTIPIYAAPQLPAVPEGWVVVPKDPTMAMMDEFDSIIDYGAEDSNDAWSRLIAAAPKPE